MDTRIGIAYYSSPALFPFFKLDLHQMIQMQSDPSSCPTWPGISSFGYAFAFLGLNTHIANSTGYGYDVRWLKTEIHTFVWLFLFKRLKDKESVILLSKTSSGCAKTSYSTSSCSAAWLWRNRADRSSHMNTKLLSKRRQQYLQCTTFYLSKFFHFH